MIDVARYQEIVSSPGKFESELAWVPYFWDLAMEGEGYVIYVSDDEDPTTLTVFQVNADEADAFGLQIGSWISLCEDSQGFVFGWNHPTAEEAEQHFKKWAGVGNVDKHSETYC